MLRSSRAGRTLLAPGGIARPLKPESFAPTVFGPSGVTEKGDGATVYVEERPAARSNVVHVYADGTRITAAGELLQGSSTGRTVPLPYRSSDVLRRLGPYDVLQELGRGGMGVVYRAYARNLGRACAIKLLTSAIYGSDMAVLRFQNEARIAAALNHPNIVQIFDTGEDESGQPYFVMELVPGTDFQHLIDAGAGHERQVVEVLAKTARALHYAHEKGVVHRDVKPENILIDDDGQPHVADFGIARLGRPDGRVTQRGAPMGTPYYMPPEQANGEIDRIGPLSDVYALGATMYHALTGRVPFDQPTPLGVLADVLAKEPDPPRTVARWERGVELDWDLETICLRAMEKDAARRYPSAAAMAEDLEAFLEDRPIAARPVGAAERFRKLVRRNRPAMVGALLGFFTLLTMVVSFGTILVFNIEQASDSLRELDRRAGVDQARTLERAIRTNMLQGRADVVRDLVTALRKDPEISSIEVVRPDRTLAYTDRSTRLQVARRLSDPVIRGRILAMRPQMLSKIEDLERIGFDNIDAASRPAEPFAYDPADWERVLDADAPTVDTERVHGEPILTVLQPIENSEACQDCHGSPEEEGYERNDVRAVLVVRRSQQRLEAQIEQNRFATIAVGALTTLIVVVLAVLGARLLGLEPRRRVFGQRA